MVLIVMLCYNSCVNIIAASKCSYESKSHLNVNDKKYIAFQYHIPIGHVLLYACLLGFKFKT